MRFSTISALPALALSLPLLAACASTGNGTRIAGDPECAQLDCEKMARVSRAARGQGLGLIWVNPPQKLRSTAPADS